MDNPLQAVMDVVKDAFSKPTLETMLHTGVGFGGTLAVAKLLSGPKVLNVASGEETLTKVERVGVTLGGTVLTTALGGMILGPAGGARMLIGGLLATLWQAVTEVVKDTSAAEFIPTLGDPVDADFRKAVETEVLRSLRGGRNMSGYLQPAGSEAYLQPAGSAAYFTPRKTGLGAFSTEMEVAGAGVGETEFGSTEMIERF